jgi:uncharacterized membrane protein YraQ (UPF0718 family)
MTPTLATFGRNLLDALAAMGWYALLAVLVAAGIKTWKLDKKIRHLLGRAGGWGIPLGALTGLISPLCSCGILPVAASLMAAGVPTAPVMALLITSPVMSPDAFLLTWGVLGASMAWGKLVAAAGFGLALGYLVQAMTRKGWIPEDPWRPAMARATHHCIDPVDPDDPRRGLEVVIPRWRYFLLMVRDMTWIIGRFFVLALVVEAFLVTFIHPNAVKVLLGRPSVLSVVLASLVGIPLPLPQIAAVPVIRGLLDLGVDRGAAMTLLMAGPVTSIPALTFLAGMVHRRLLWAYLAVAWIGSILAGLLYRG